MMEHVLYLMAGQAVAALFVLVFTGVVGVLRSDTVAKSLGAGLGLAIVIFALHWLGQRFFEILPKYSHLLAG